MTGIKNVFGGYSCQTSYPFGDPAVLKEAFDVLEQGNCHTIDTAALYGDSEKTLGENHAGRRFTLDTKLKGGFGGEGGSSKAKILEDFETSKKLLGTNVDILYLHSPDASTPLEETLAAINEIYKTGFFKRFGVSNFKAEDVEKAYDIAKEKGYPLPQVYQGNYNPVARKQEEVLFPTLRKLGISFYAYSPLAGGFLVKTREEIEGGAASGRWEKGTMLGDMYLGMYGKPTYLEALAEWDRIAKEEGVTKAELAYRWVKYNSPLKAEQGDAIIFGATKPEQLKQTVKTINNGPLSEKAAAGIDAIWKKIEHEAPLDNFHG